jgi:NTP pyrophosphatase (non-canonical NTP hydrolase)
MHVQVFQTTARQYRQSPTETEGNLVVYPAMGLAGESGEVANDVKKYMRRGIDLHQLKGRAVEELGDVLWYVAALSDDLGLRMDTIMHNNLAKLDHTYGLEAASRGKGK